MAIAGTHVQGTTGELPPALILGSDFKALGVVRSLGRRGIRCMVIDAVPRSAWFSRYTRRRIRWHGSLGDEALLRFLLSLGSASTLQGAVLFPLQDEAVELVSRHYAELAPLYRLTTPPWEIARWALDKRLTYQMAEQLAIPAPRTWYPASEEALASLDLQFPLIVKPAISVHLQYTLHLKALEARNYAELLAAYRQARSVLDADEILLQELIPGSGLSQYSVGAFCSQGQVLSALTARRLRQYPIDYGLGSSFVEAVEVPALYPLAEKILRFMGVSGMIEVEFKFDQRDSLYKLLDINLRPWGWHTLCIACGLDLPYLQYCQAIGIAGEIPLSLRYGVRWLRLLTDLPAGFQEIRAGLTNPFAYLRSLVGPVTFSVFALNDPLPAFGDLLVAVLRATHLMRPYPRPQAPHPSSPLR
uniref:carboxylate--amine ligase n=2 Tax=Thermogemmatispora sp. TaxID=1968838 RepID=UPI002ACC3163